MKNDRTQVFLITGASSGIGESCAYELIRQGVCVVLFARREERLREVHSKIEKSHPGQSIYCVGDVRVRADLDQAVSKAVSKWGRLDGLLANAGFGVSGRFEKLTIDDFKRQFDTNVYGVLESIYACLSEIKKTKEK